MQNLTLPLSQQATTVKQSTNKPETLSDKSAGGAGFTSFQQVLSQQVEVKKANAEPSAKMVQSAVSPVKTSVNASSNASHAALKKPQGAASSPAPNASATNKLSAHEAKKSDQTDPSKASANQQENNQPADKAAEASTEHAVAAVQTDGTTKETTQLKKSDKEVNVADLAANPDAVTAANAVLAGMSVQPTAIKSAVATEEKPDEQVAVDADTPSKGKPSAQAMLENGSSDEKGPALAADDVLKTIQDSKAASLQSSMSDVMSKGQTSGQFSDTLNLAKLTNNASEATQQVNNQAAIMQNVMTTSTNLANLNATQQVAASNVIEPTFGKAGWNEAVNQKVVWMVGAGEQTASLTLNPPDLGPVQVVIHVHNDQADTTFISDNQDVRQALESGLSHLREKMSEAGVQLGQTNISSGGQAQQQFQQTSQNNASTQGGGRRNEANTDTSAVNVNTSGRIVKASNGLVDTFV